MLYEDYDFDGKLKPVLGCFSLDLLISVVFSGYKCISP